MHYFWGATSMYLRYPLVAEKRALDMILSGEVPRVVNKWWHEEPFILGNLVYLCRVCDPLNSLFRALGVKLAPHIVYVY